jgi:hypothetical protein
MTTEDAKNLREAWAAVKEGRASDRQWLLLFAQRGEVLDHLKLDYDRKRSPYRTSNERAKADIAP